MEIKIIETVKELPDNNLSQIDVKQKTVKVYPKDALYEITVETAKFTVEKTATNKLYAIFSDVRIMLAFLLLACVFFFASLPQIGLAILLSTMLPMIAVAAYFQWEISKVIKQTLKKYENYGGEKL